MTSPSSSGPTIACGDAVDGDDDVGRLELRRAGRRARRPRRRSARPAPAPARPAVGDEDRLHALLGQRPRRQLARLAGADDHARGARRSPSAWRASSTATEDTDDGPREIAVSVRTRLPVGSAAPNSRLVSGPVSRPERAARRRAAPGPGPRTRRRSSTRAPRSRGRGGAPRRSCAASTRPTASSVGRMSPSAGQRPQRRVLGRDRVGGDEVELGAVAGRDRDGLVDVGVGRDRSRRKRSARPSVQRDPLAQRTGAVLCETPSSSSSRSRLAPFARSSTSSSLRAQLVELGDRASMRDAAGWP